MSEVKEITVNVDEYLAIDKYEVDEESAHIELDYCGPIATAFHA